MHKFETLQQAENYLLGYSPLKPDGATYTLGRMRQLMAKLGNPQNELKVIHIAGTSGKTSTAYFVRALLEETGQKTGLTVSPHITSITERVQIGGRPLPDAVFVTYLQEFFLLLENWPQLKPTYFELMIAFAYWVFRREKVGYAVVETGLGGLLDATNVVTRQDKVCALTPIGLDHTNVLGGSITQIAEQKAGIIQLQNVVFSARQAPDAAALFQKACRQQLASLEFINSEPKDAGLRLPEFQYQNWHLACAVFGYVQRRDDLAELTHDKEWEASRSMPPGRFERYKAGVTTIILDGAHNPQKLQALIDSLPAAAKDAVWLMAMAEAPNQKLEDSLKVLAVAAEKIVWTDFQVGQDFKARQSFVSSNVAERARHYGIHSDAHPDAFTALQYALEQKPSYLIITGSLFLVARLRPELERLAKRQFYQPPAK
ncbi:Folylpolyglutamate synthase/dihydrofolate synthase [Candidatus Saccharibacteria bacterium RAAC3_TM7_1]|nr:Folylpolyglutamate synthase/dihydrofolate synthase [Candidatus Saccharibacteria bacterium RAAC3_TM7_1]HCZ28231.1 hypothetical protein [Candidatus Saccharibacteria bacterium]